MKYKYILIFLLISIPLTSSAYIPRFWMIMSRTAENHGRGIYKVIQNVTFLHKSEPLTLRETWIIKDGEQMRVTVTGLGTLKGKVNFTRIISGHKKLFLSSEGTIRVLKVTANWIESYFHFRFSKNIKPVLFSQQIIPSEGLTLPPPFVPKKKNSKDLNSHKDDFLRLGRVNGLTAYAIGTPTLPSSIDPEPGLWIEQDQFNILKVRLKSKTEISAKNYTKYSRGLRLARLREVSWEGARAEIHIVSVKGLPNTQSIKKLLTAKSLGEIKSKQMILSKGEYPILADFYQRFR